MTGALQLDHVFVLCAPGAPEAEALLRRGFAEGPRNAHPGQGTANRRFFFDDVYLELLWVDDAKAARGASARVTQLWERWTLRDGGASPFGLVLRRMDERAALPFAAREYRPAYLPAGSAIALADGVPLAEPLIAVLPALPRPRQPAAATPGRGAVLRSLRRVEVCTPAAGQLSAASRCLRDACVIGYRDGSHALALAFAADGDVVHDLHPALPLVLRGSAPSPGDLC